MHVGVLEYLAVATVVLFGSVVQGSIGVGLNMISAPFVAIHRARGTSCHPRAARIADRDHHAPP